MIEPFYGANLLGSPLAWFAALLIGVGFVMSGWCPSTGAVGLASSKLDALVFLGGIILGVVAFNEMFAWIKPLYHWGLQAEPSFAFGFPKMRFVLLLSVVGVAAFYPCEWIEKTSTRERQYLKSPFLQAFSIAVVGLAAALLIFPTQSVATAAN